MASAPSAINSGALSGVMPPMATKGRPKALALRSSTVNIGTVLVLLVSELLLLGSALLVSVVSVLVLMVSVLLVLGSALLMLMPGSSLIE